MLRERWSENDAALDLYLRVIALVPGNARACAGAAFECLRADRLEQAEELLARGYASCARDNREWPLLAEAEAALLCLRGEQVSAIRLFAEILSETRDIERLSRCLTIVARRGRFDELLDLLTGLRPVAADRIPVPFDFEWRWRVVESARRLFRMAHERRAFEKNVELLQLKAPISYDEHRLDAFDAAEPLVRRASKHYCFGPMLPGEGPPRLPAKVYDMVSVDMPSLRHWPALRQTESAYSTYLVQDCMVFKAFPRAASCVVTQEGRLIDELVPALSPMRLSGVIPVSSEPGSIDGLDEAFVLPDNNGWRSHYHTVVNICSSLFFYERLELTCDVIVPGELTRAQREILRVSGVGGARRVFSADDVSCVPIGRAYCGGKIGGQLLREWYRTVTSRLLGTEASRAPGTVLYISREDAITRTLADEDRLQDELSRRFGTRIAHMENLSFDAQVRAVCGARVLIAPHGAGLTNLIFAAPGTWVIELLPDRHARQTFRDLAAVAGHRYVPLVGKVDDAETTAWRIDTTNVIRVVETILDLSEAD